MFFLNFIKTFSNKRFPIHKYDMNKKRDTRYNNITTLEAKVAHDNAKEVRITENFIFYIHH